MNLHKYEINKMKIRGGILFIFILFSTPCLADINFISPGPLAKAHGEFDQAAGCPKCHGSGKGVSVQLCLDCHKEIKTRVDKKIGYHGKMTNLTSQCSTCHPDHAGKDFDMIEWKPSQDQFDHSSTGYPLQGGHAKVKCLDCHNSQRIVDIDIKTSQKKRTKTFLGLSQACKTCHFDEHRGQLGKKCQSCHTEKDWKTDVKFNHDKSSFPLKGKHTQVECEKCHKPITDKISYIDKSLQPKSSTFSRFKPVPHASCENCHADVHKGKFGKKCQSCHSELSWKQFSGAKIEDRNFHDKTRYPLVGAHATVACKNCHGPWGNQKAQFKNLEFQKCTDCHEDAHEGQFPIQKKSTDGKSVVTCDRCHTMENFTSIKYSVQDHAQTDYPLEGAHAAIPCKSCHIEDKNLDKKIPSSVLKKLQAQGRSSTFSFAQFKFTGDLNQCEACHEDVHQKQFKNKKCATCHTYVSFMKIKFQHNQDSRYALKGKHQEVPCFKCHKTIPGENGKTVEIYKPIDTKCSTCHVDIHVGQMKKKNGELQACEWCHTEIDWKVVLFDHNNKRFSDYLLEGKHKDVACNKCHYQAKVSENLSVTVYKPLSRNCFGCHADFHKGEFGDLIQ